MKINVTKFLASIKVNLSNASDGVNVKCRCPLHSDPGYAMSVITDRITGVTRFACAYPGCAFRGDAVSLIAAMRNVSVKDAVAMLAPGGELSDTLAEPLRESEIQMYLDRHASHAQISAYITRCQQALKIHPEKCKLRAGLSTTSLRLIPPELGLIVIDNDMPDAFYEFRKSKYKNSTLLCCPFTYHGEITHVDVYDADCPTFKYTVGVSRVNSGVYLEDFNEEHDKLVVMDDAIAISTLYGHWMTDSVKKPPFAAISGFPLPESFNNVRLIRILSTPDYPLTLERALEIVSSPGLTSGDVNPVIQVWGTATSTRDFTPEGLRQVVYANKFSVVLSIEEYVAKQLQKCCETGKLSYAANAVRKYPVSKLVRSLIAEQVTSKSLSPEILSILDEETTNLSDISLANGRMVRIRPTEVCAVSKNSVITLSNVGIAVDHKIRTYDGDEILSCTITVPDPEIPPAKVNFPEKSWSRASDLKKIVTKAFTSSGNVPYIAFYEQRGYSWDDILGKLAEKCPLSREISELGLDEAACFNMPEFTINNTTRTIDTQNKVFTLPDSVLRAYSGISGSECMNPVEPFRKLLKNCSNLYVAAFTCGLMHVIYQMTYSIYRTRLSRKQPPRHMFFVETESGIWGGVFKQLADMFSGSDFTPAVSYADPGSTLEEYEQLGSLPLIAYVPSMGNKLAEAIDNHSVPIVGLVDSTTAVLTNGRIPVTYVTPSDEQPSNAMIVQDGIDGIREAMASFLLVFFRDANINTEYRTARIPCLAAYREACRICGVKECQTVENIVKPYFPGAGMTGVNTFFDMIHRGIIDDRRKTHICVLNEAPQNGFSFTGRGQHVFVLKDCVLIGHNVVDLVNRASESTFAIDQLSREFSERKMLGKLPADVDIDPARCWCIPRDTWERDVVRPPVQMAQAEECSRIELKE